MHGSCANVYSLKGLKKAHSERDSSVKIQILVSGSLVLFRDSDAEGEDLAQPEFRGLWEEGVHKVGLE